jgi:hypothetical protein
MRVICVQNDGDFFMPAVRTMTNVKKCVLASALWVAILGPCIASAALGEPQASVQADAAQLRGSLQVTEHANYQIHEIRLPTGTLLREFVGPHGNVFAVAWRGPTIPNLRQAFGRYFDTYVAAAGDKHLGHSQLQIRRSDLIVQSGGHMRAFAGHAYLPQAVPDGVSIGELH